MSENMRDMTLNLIVNSQVNKIKEFNRNLKDTKASIDNVSQKTGWLSKNLGRLFGAYFSIRGVQGIVKTYRNLDLMRRSIEGLTQSTEDWEYLTKEAFRTATDIEVVAKGYRNFYAAASMAGVDKGGVQNMYSNILEAGRAVGATQTQVEGALLALEQMFSKGRVSMEELRRQLGNALPGAFEVAAKSMGVTTQQFNEMIKKGVQATDLVPKFTAEYKKTFEKSFPQAMKSLDAAIVNLGTSWKLFQYDFMQSGAGRELAKVLVQVSQILQSQKLKMALQSLGFVVGQITSMIGYLIQNLKTIFWLLAPIALGGALDNIVSLLKQAVVWLSAGNLQLSASQKMLFRILIILAGIQEIIAFFTPMDGALETAILGKDQSWINKIQYLIGGLSSIYFMLDAIMGFRMTKSLFGWLGSTKAIKGIKSWAGIGKNAKEATKTVAEITQKKPSILLDQYGRPLVQGTTSGAGTAAKKGATNWFGRYVAGMGSKTAPFLKGLGFALGEVNPLMWAYTIGDLTAGREYRQRQESIQQMQKRKEIWDSLRNNKDMSISALPSKSAFSPLLPFGGSSPQLNKTEVSAPTINYQPKYHIEANNMTPEQLKSMLDERDKNFWTSMLGGKYSLTGFALTK